MLKTNPFGSWNTRTILATPLSWSSTEQIPENILQWMQIPLIFDLRDHMLVGDVTLSSLPSAHLVLVSFIVYFMDAPFIPFISRNPGFFSFT